MDSTINPVLYYEGFDEKEMKISLEKTLSQLGRGDFKSADVKKMASGPYYRAKLDDKNRLLFTFVSYQAQQFPLILEVIKNHDYGSSRFLRGAPLPGEDKWLPVAATGGEIADCQPLRYLSRSSNRIHILNKFISFDEAQQPVLQMHPPLILIGSAGSGKTVLMLEKLKQLKGSIAYVSLSQYLVENARKMYYAQGYENEDQEIDFLSFRSYLESWKIPAGREADYAQFESWFNRHAQHVKLKEPHRVFEEFKGVITGSPLHRAWLTQEEYAGLGIRQSIFPEDKRETVYALFEKYVAWLKDNGLFDLNILSYEYTAYVKPRYDYVMIDEVQDITAIQLKLILQSLQHKGRFLLSGDSNQIVHPNFFSWSRIKRFFYEDSPGQHEICVLRTNYRNALEVVSLSNALLKIKNARFGSIDRESNYLINTVSEDPGEAILLPDSDKIKTELNQKTQRSIRYAVIVAQDHQKAEARQLFKTPLIFSVHEAKGLEYENVILLNFVSGNPREFSEIIRDVTPEHLDTHTLEYARAADKGDKDAEVYKFYVNGLYVAVTRAIRNIYLLEKDLGHRLFSLVGLRESDRPLGLQEQRSEDREWLEEAERLEKQGRYEQAQQIRAKIHGYEYVSPEAFDRMRELALDPSKKEHEVKKERKYLFQYASKNLRLDWINELALLGFQRAVLFMKGVRQDRKEYDKNIRLGRKAEVRRLTDKYGIDFQATDDGVTGLMLALQYGQQEMTDFFRAGKAATGAVTAGGEMPLHFLLRGFLQRVFRRHTSGATEDFLTQYWHLARPDSVTVETGVQRMQVSGRSMALFLLAVMHAAAELTPSKVTYSPTDPAKERKTMTVFSMDMMMRFLVAIPDSVLPPYRKKRPYVNGVLALHEAARESPQSKHLFMRADRGCYTIHPDLSLPNL